MQNDTSPSFFSRLGVWGAAMAALAVLAGALAGWGAGHFAGEKAFKSGFEEGKKTGYAEGYEKGKIETRDKNADCAEAFGDAKTKAFQVREGENAERLRRLKRDAAEAYREGLLQGLKNTCPADYARGFHEGETQYERHFHWDLSWRVEVKSPWWKLWGGGESLKLYERAQLHFKDFPVGGAYEIKRYEGDIARLGSTREWLKERGRRDFGFEPEVKELPDSEMKTPVLALPSQVSPGEKNTNTPQIPKGETAEREKQGTAP